MAGVVTHYLAWALHHRVVARPRVKLFYDAACGPSAPLAPDELYLWLIRTPTLSFTPDQLLCLSESETARAKLFCHESDRSTYLLAHLSLRRILARVLRRPESDIAFQFGLYGKPSLTPNRVGECLADPIQFNISHTRGATAIALSRHRVGVDIELVKPFPDYSEIADRYFALEESTAIREAKNVEEGTTLFYRFWTLGEAFIKATGRGLSQDLGSFAFTPVGPPELLRNPPDTGQPQEWSFGLLPRIWRQGNWSAIRQQPPVMSPHIVEGRQMLSKSSVGGSP